MLKRSKYSLALLLAFSLVFGSLLSAASAAVPQDVQKHWAADTLEKWIDAGMIKGYPDGSFKPNAPVKRGELAALINRAFGLSEAGTDVSFGDLPKDSWAYQDIAVAVTAGYIHGSGNGNVSPNGNATRQEAAQMIASALGLDTQAAGDLSQFRDAAKIAEWSKGAVAALAANNIFKGDDKNEFRPNAPITRAEAVVALDAAMVLKAPKVYDQPGVFGSVYGTDTINGDVEIKSDGVTLQNTVINGNLVIAKEVGDGDVTLKNVTVKGTTTVNGGGENSVHLEDSVLLRIIVDKPTGKVRIVAIGATTVQDVVVNSSAKIEESHVTDTGFSNIELSSALPTGSSVDLVGQYEDVQVLAANIQLNIPSGSIQNLSVAEGASNNTINVGKEAQVLQLVLDAVSKLIGQGQVSNATVNEQAKGSTFETKPGQVSGSGKDSATVTTPSTGVVGGGSGGGSGGGNDNAAACNSDCDNANMMGLSIISSVYDFQLTQLDSRYQIIGSGFSSNVFRYVSGIPQNFPESDISFSVTAAAYAKVNYLVRNDDLPEYVSYGRQNSFNVHLSPNHDVLVEIYVTSGDGKRQKQYEVLFNYQRSLQQSFRLSKSSPVLSYHLITQSLELGDEVAITVPSTDSSLGTEFSVLNTIINKNSSIDITNDAANPRNQFVPHDLQGTLKVKVTRAGTEIMNGEYHYDLSPLPEITDLSGMHVDLLTKQELAEHDAQSYEAYKSSYGWKLYLDKTQASAELLDVKYVRTRWETKFQQSTVWTVDDMKTSISNLLTLGPPLYPVDDSTRTTREFFLGSDKAIDQYLYVFFYDSNRNLIGYHKYDIVFDEDHVGDNVTIVHP